MAHIIATQKSDWVSFNDDLILQGATEQNQGSQLPKQFSDPEKSLLSLQSSPVNEIRPTVADNLVSGHLSKPQDHLNLGLSTWVQFEEPLPPVAKENGKTASSVGAPDQKCFGQAPSGRSSLTSQSNSDVRYEDISMASIGPHKDLSSIQTDNAPSEDASGTGSPDNSSSFQEDEDLDMENLGCSISSFSINGHTDSPTKSTFRNWVTFEDEVVSPSPKDSNQKQQESPKSSFKKRERPKSSLVDFQRAQRLDFKSLHRQLSLNSPPTKTPNPFHDETLKNVLPSPINPFSSYFEKQEKLSECSSVSSDQEPCQRNFTSLLSEELDTEQFEDYRKKTLQADAVECLKQIQLEDPDSPGSPTLPDDPLKDVDTIGPSLSFTKPQPKDGWSMMLRIPEKKNIMSSRHWGPIYVKVTESGILQLFYEKGLEKPFREYKLEQNHEISEPKLQNYDENGRIHTIRIDKVIYREKRKYQPMPLVTHTGEKEQVVKLGTTDYSDFISFIANIQDILFMLPATIDLSTVHQNYTEEDITVDVRDEFHGILGKGDNQLILHSVVTHIYILSFISGIADCRMGLNDILIKGNEVVARNDIMPTTTTKWVQLHECKFHASVDEKMFHSSRMVVFTPLDACKFELMRFRTLFSEKTLPFTLRTAVCVRGAEVQLQSWLVMSTGFSSNRDNLLQVPCENVTIRHPVPAEWVNYFRRDSMLGERSLKAKINREASFGSPGLSGSEPAMRVTLGTAKYENAYNAVVWRINRLPDKNSDWNQPHCFYCHLELGSDREIPLSFVPYVEVEFDMPAASASKVAVRSLSVEEKTNVKKWVNYSAHYFYKVEIEQKKTLNQDLEGGDVEKPSECSVQ
ncbi:stonin-2-like isoform X1 [Xenopus laevis]|uniref:Stonin-2-like isoform X1 n=2 Tax=Xenopus laevis TaxID=8355 RepID=A0A1L8F9D9_XENLA|nr:stonin-2-like isoform X1 [Xenopus laevis]XP_041428934.1 stonin-2-like isoform X1 [Xenopus laevis]OCT68205.1 hypothetical protein XELAEV_18039501mg [Xenopus laevis]